MFRVRREAIMFGLDQEREVNEGEEEANPNPPSHFVRRLKQSLTLGDVAFYLILGAVISAALGILSFVWKGG